MIEHMTDRAIKAQDLETRIKAKGEEAMRLACAFDSKGARRCYVEMYELTKQRDAETIERLERERGLR